MNKDQRLLLMLVDILNLRHNLLSVNLIKQIETGKTLRYNSYILGTKCTNEYSDICMSLAENLSNDLKLIF